MQVKNVLILRYIAFYRSVLSDPHSYDNVRENVNRHDRSNDDADFRREIRYCRVSVDQFTELGHKKINDKTKEKPDQPARKRKDDTFEERKQEVFFAVETSGKINIVLSFSVV